MRISSRIFTVRYECFFVELYLMKEGDIRRRLIIRDKAMQDHLKKPARSDWPCEDYDLYDIALVKKHTLEKLKSVYRTLPPEMKMKALPASPIQLSLTHDVIPRIGTLVSFGYYRTHENFSVDLIEQSTGQLIRVTGPMLEDALRTSGADRNDLINIQPTSQEDVLFTETQYNPDGTQNDSIDEQTITSFLITKLEKTYVQQTNCIRSSREETSPTLLSEPEPFYGGQSSNVYIMEEQDYSGMGFEDDVAQTDVFRETS